MADLNRSAKMENPGKSLLEKFRVAGWLEAAAMVEKDDTGGSASMRFSKEAADKLVVWASILIELEHADLRLTESEMSKLKDVAYSMLKARLNDQRDNPHNPRLE